MPELPGLVHIIDMVYIVNTELLSVFYNPGKFMKFMHWHFCLQRVFTSMKVFSKHLKKEEVGGGGEK